MAKKEREKINRQKGAGSMEYTFKYEKLTFEKVHNDDDR